MEGINLAAIFLVFLGMLVVGITSLVALGLLIARRATAARITFAAGVFAMAVSGALAVVSFLQRGMGFYDEGSEPMIFVTALSLVVAGAGQFLAALRRPEIYGAAFGFAAGALALLAGPLLSGDALGPVALPQLLGARSLSLPGIRLGLALSLLLAALSLLTAIVTPGRRRAALLLTALAGLGGIAGFALGDSLVATRATLIRGVAGGGPHEVRVEVEFLGEPVSDEIGLAPIPREGLELVRVVSGSQAAWVYGPLVVGAAAGAVVGLVGAACVMRFALAA